MRDRPLVGRVKRAAEQPAAPARTPLRRHWCRRHLRLRCCCCLLLLWPPPQLAGAGPPLRDCAPAAPPAGRAGRKRERESVITKEGSVKHQRGKVNCRRRRQQAPAPTAAAMAATQLRRQQQQQQQHWRGPEPSSSGGTADGSRSSSTQDLQLLTATVCNNNTAASVPSPMTLCISCSRLGSRGGCYSSFWCISVISKQ